MKDVLDIDSSVTALPFHSALSCLPFDLSKEAMNVAKFVCASPSTLRALKSHTDLARDDLCAFVLFLSEGMLQADLCAHLESKDVAHLKKHYALFLSILLSATKNMQSTCKVKVTFGSSSRSFNFQVNEQVFLSSFVRSVLSEENTTHEWEGKAHTIFHLCTKQGVLLENITDHPGDILLPYGASFRVTEIIHSKSRLHTYVTLCDAE